jgi:hypothetical protein
LGYSFTLAVCSNICEATSDHAHANDSNQISVASQRMAEAVRGFTT